LINRSRDCGADCSRNYFLNIRKMRLRLINENTSSIRRLRNSPAEIEWFTFRSCCTSHITLSRCTILHESHENCTCRDCTLSTLWKSFHRLRDIWKNFIASFSFNEAIVLSLFVLSLQLLIQSPLKSKSQARISTVKIL